MASKTAIEAHLRRSLRELRCPVVAGWEISNAPPGITRLGKKIVPWRDHDDRVHKLEDHCPHRSARLSMGWNLGERIACWYHGAALDVISPPMRATGSSSMRTMPVSAHPEATRS